MQYAHNDGEDDGKEESAERVNAKELSRKSIRINKPRTNKAGVCRRVAVVVGAATVCDDARSPSAYVATSLSLSMAAEAELSQALLLLYSGSEGQKIILFANDSGKKYNKMRKQMQASKLLANKSLLLLLCYFDTDFLLMKLIWDETQLAD